MKKTTEKRKHSTRKIISKQDMNKEQSTKEDGMKNIELEKHTPKDNANSGNNEEDDRNYHPTGDPTGAAIKPKESKPNYTKEKLFHCVMPCNKGKAANFPFPKEYSVMATVMIMGLIPYNKHLYGNEAKTWFGWSKLSREDSS
jgi:hypothetical protein